jgi:hypothetical protein
MTSGEKQKSKDRTVIEVALRLPVCKTQCRVARIYPSTKVFSPPGRAKRLTPSPSVIKKEKEQNNDSSCGSCRRLCSDDTRKKNGAEWMQCTFCRVRYHTICQNVVDGIHFMCDGCEDSHDSE